MNNGLLGAILLSIAALAPACAFAQDIPVCPGAMPPLGFSTCEIALKNGHLEDRPRGSVSNNPVWHTLPGWQSNGPVRMGTIWRHQNAVSIAVGLEPGRSIGQTVAAPRMDAIPGSPLPTYELHFSASPLGEQARDPLTARLVGVSADGSEKELARVDVEPHGDQLETYRMSAAPFDVPMALRVEFSRPEGSGALIYVDNVGLLQTLR